jgi:alpha-beta hydrolase superfamily lysophospholipase
MSAATARALRAGRQVAGVVGGAAAATAVVTTAVAAYFTRRVVTPDHVKPDDVQVLDVDLAATPPTVTLARTDDTAVDGRYGLWWDGRDGHAHLGRVLFADDDLVVRELLAVEQGELRAGPARWNQYFYSGPPGDSLGLAHDDVEVATELGPMPAWHVPADAAGELAGSGTWAVLVHGRGATREECLRAVPPLHRLGLPVLVPSYRNDLDAPADPAGRYHLGDREWSDVEAAVEWAVARGAQRIVLIGWSMGGAVVLQAATRSSAADRVVAVVLDAPVVDWHAVLEHHARANHLPGPVARLGHAMMRHPLGRRVIGLEQPLDLRRLDWVSRAGELALPVLLIHSDADEFVPNAPSKALAATRPDLVTLVPWREGRHTKEWNTDPDRWDDVVASFVRDQVVAAVRRASTA